MPDLEDLLTVDDAPKKKRAVKTAKPAKKPKAKAAKVKSPRAPKSKARKPRAPKAKKKASRKKLPEPAEAGTGVDKPTSMADAMKKAKHAYLTAVDVGAITHDGAEPGELDMHPEEKKDAYKEYRDTHSGAVGKHEKTGGKKIEIIRVPSGIPGLDPMIEGGFKNDSTVLITGGPGCGKTTFMIQYLYNGALSGEAGLHISFEENEQEILEDYAGFDWDLQGMVDKNLLHFLHYQPHEVEKIMEQGGGLIKDLIKDAKIKRVTLDSLTSFAMLFKTEYEKRTNVLKFFEMLEAWGCTVLLSSERSATLDAAIGEFGLEFLVDGAILMYNVRKGNTREQAIEVLKMRATKIKRRICPITISSSGITVYPDAEVFTAFE